MKPSKYILIQTEFPKSIPLGFDLQGFLELACPIVLHGQAFYIFFAKRQHKVLFLKFFFYLKGREKERERESNLSVSPKWESGAEGFEPFFVALPGAKR